MKVSHLFYDLDGVLARQVTDFCVWEILSESLFAVWILVDGPVNFSHSRTFQSLGHSADAAEHFQGLQPFLQFGPFGRFFRLQLTIEELNHGSPKTSFLTRLRLFNIQFNSCIPVEV